MAWVETRITRTSQPQDAVGVDWANPLALGLISALSPKGDAVTNKAFQRQGTPTIAANATGVAVIGTGNSYIKSSISPAAFNKPEVTLFYVGSVPWVLNSVPASVTGSGGTQLLTFIFDSSSRQKVVYRATNGGVPVTRLYDVYQPVGVFNWGTTYDGTSDLKIYNNGNAVTTNATIGTLNNATPTGFDSVCLGGADRSSYLFQGSGGQANVVYAWNRALSADEHKSLSDNPWQIFEPEVTRIWVDDFIDAGGTTTVTTDASASYTVAGSVQADATASYAVSTSATADAAASYKIASAVQQDATAQYAIRAAVTADASASYALIAASSVTADASVSYVVRSATTSDASASYVVRGAVQQDAAASYAVRAAVFADAVASYALIVDGQVTADASGSYQIRGAVQSDASLAYEIAGAVQSSASAGYVVQGMASADASAAYVVQGAVVADAVGSYLVDGAVLVLQPSIYAAYVPVPRNQAQVPLAANQAHVPNPTNQAYLP